eukprot:622628-Rhodomonas_salina.2
MTTALALTLHVKKAVSAPRTALKSDTPRRGSGSHAGSQGPQHSHVGERRSGKPRPQPWGWTLQLGSTSFTSRPTQCAIQEAETAGHLCKLAEHRRGFACGVESEVCEAEPKFRIGFLRASPRVRCGLRDRDG